MFLIFCAGGGAAALCYAVLHALCAAGKHAFMMHVTDVLFILLAGACYLACSVRALGGAFRLYALCAYGAGFLVFHIGIGRPITRALIAVFCFLGALVRRAGAKLNSILEKKNQKI